MNFFYIFRDMNMRSIPQDAGAVKKIDREGGVKVVRNDEACG